jgi:hypothetical protein
MCYIDEILENYDRSFVDDYIKWKSLVEDMNKFVLDYLDNISLTKHKITMFTYNEFCTLYKNECEVYMRSGEIVDRDSVRIILDKILYNKIVKSLTE